MKKKSDQKPVSAQARHLGLEDKFLDGATTLGTWTAFGHSTNDKDLSKRQANGKGLRSK